MLQKVIEKYWHMSYRWGIYTVLIKDNVEIQNVIGFRDLKFRNVYIWKRYLQGILTTRYKICISQQ